MLSSLDQIMQALSSLRDGPPSGLSANIAQKEHERRFLGIADALKHANRLQQAICLPRKSAA